jgi:hypothetical protein
MKQHPLHKEITFFHTGGGELHQMEPLAEEARNRGFKVRLTTNLHEKAHIGVYCQHQCYPENSEFSIIMLHDMGQGQNRWPNIWEFENWNGFDLGILPGEEWEERWKSCSWDPVSIPRQGVFTLGWPKSDLIRKKDFNNEAHLLSEKFNFTHPITILYAPSWEYGGKQYEFVQALKDLPVNLVLKQCSWKSGSGWIQDFPHIIDNIKEMNALHENYAPNVHVADSEINIMYYLSMADIIVSDESSVLFESLLFNTVGIAVTDWEIPDTEVVRTASVPYSHVIKTEKQNIKQTVEAVLVRLNQAKIQCSEHMKRNFSNIGNSSFHIMQLIESYTAPVPLSCSPVQGELDNEKITHLLTKSENDLRTMRLNIYINKLSQMMIDNPSRKIVVWGAGELGKKTAKYFQSRNITIHGFLDKNPHKWGELLEGKEISSPSIINDDVNTKPYVLIGTSFSYEVICELLERGYSPGLDYYNAGNILLELLLV